MHHPLSEREREAAARYQHGARCAELRRTGRTWREIAAVMRRPESTCRGLAAQWERAEGLR